LQERRIIARKTAAVMASWAPKQVVECVTPP
jgi:hypothetical protein